MKLGKLFIGVKKARLIHQRDPGRKVKMTSWLLLGWRQWGISLMHNDTKEER